MFEVMVDGFRWGQYADRDEAEKQAGIQRRKSSVLAAWVEEV